MNALEELDAPGEWYLDRVRKLLTHMELSESAEFMNHYVAALFLPHTDMSLFPTVREKLAGL